jgi:hypothetical protein
VPGGSNQGFVGKLQKKNPRLCAGDEIDRLGDGSSCSAAGTFTAPCSFSPSFSRQAVAVCPCVWPPSARSSCSWGACSKDRVQLLDWTCSALNYLNIDWQLDPPPPRLSYYPGRKHGMLLGHRDETQPNRLVSSSP